MKKLFAFLLLIFLVDDYHADVLIEDEMVLVIADSELYGM